MSSKLVIAGALVIIVIVIIIAIALFFAKNNSVVAVQSNKTLVYYQNVLDNIYQNFTSYNSFSIKYAGYEKLEYIDGGQYTNYTIPLNFSYQQDMRVMRFNMSSAAVNAYTPSVSVVNASSSLIYICPGEARNSANSLDACVSFKDVLAFPANYKGAPLINQQVARGTVTSGLKNRIFGKRFFNGMPCIYTEISENSSSQLISTGSFANAKIYSCMSETTYIPVNITINYTVFFNNSKGVSDLIFLNETSFSRNASYVNIDKLPGQVNYSSGVSSLLDSAYVFTAFFGSVSQANQQSDNYSQQNEWVLIPYILSNLYIAVPSATLFKEYEQASAYVYKFVGYCYVVNQESCSNPSYSNSTKNITVTVGVSPQSALKWSSLEVLFIPVNNSAYSICEGIPTLKIGNCPFTFNSYYNNYLANIFDSPYAISINSTFVKGRNVTVQLPVYAAWQAEGNYPNNTISGFVWEKYNVIGSSYPVYQSVAGIIVNESP